MSISMLLLILRIIGALPQIIEMAKRILEMIRKIRNPRKRRDSKRKLRAALWDNRKSVRKMTIDEEKTCLHELKCLEDEVLQALKKEGRHA